MADYKYKKLSKVQAEDDFESSTSKHLIVEDGGEIKRVKAPAKLPSATPQDTGKIVGVNDSGNYELITNAVLADATLIIS